jgi:hypothetical protein
VPQQEQLDKVSKIINKTVFLKTHHVCDACNITDAYDNWLSIQNGLTRLAKYSMKLFI